MTSDFFRVVNEARRHSLGPFSPLFNIQTCLLEGLQKFLPHDAHKRVNGKLHISLTRVYDGKNVIVSHYNSREDLLNALLCACFIPIFSGILPPRFHGVRYMDGAFSDNLPLIDENTVTVSPFCGESDICPRDNSWQMFYVNWANTSIEISRQNLDRFSRILYPPNSEVMSKICQAGFDDALRFLHRNNLITCARCVAVQSTFLITKTEVLPQNEQHALQHREHEQIEQQEEQQEPKESGEEEMQTTTVHEVEPECHGCLEQRKEAKEGNMPETVIDVFNSYINQANKGFMSWLFKHRTARLLKTMITLPATLPTDIFIATVKK